MLDQQSNEERWVGIAVSLRAFYYDYKVFGEALALDKMAHEKLNSAETAAALGISVSTVEREWRYIRAWLECQLGGDRE